ncbi:DUF599 domain-containing protein [Mesorhizobium sp. 10J20-29]
MAQSMLLSSADLAALGFFLAVWAAYALALRGTLFGRVSLTSAMNAQRAAWMQVMARRELRMIDTGIMLGLQQGTAFFASSALLALGGCFALFGASDQVIGVLSDLTLGATPSRELFEVKVIGLILLLAHAFFKFGWSYRLFNYCSILIGAVPTMRDEAEQSVETERAVRRAAEMNILAGKHFNAGLRAIFFSIGYLGWFVGPPAFALSTLVLFAVLIRRQFFSAARRAVLSDGGG